MRLIDEMTEKTLENFFYHVKYMKNSEEMKQYSNITLRKKGNIPDFGGWRIGQ